MPKEKERLKASEQCPFVCNSVKPIELHHDKASLQSFQPGPTQTGLNNHWRWLDAGNY